MDVRTIRRATGLSQARFASDFGIALGTLRDWEQGRKLPDGPARTLLTVIASDAAAVHRALAGGAAPAPADPEPAPRDWLERYLAALRIDRPDLDADAFIFRAAITQIAHTMEHEFRALAYGPLQLGVGELRALLALRRAPPSYTLRFAQLSQHMLVTSGAISKQIRRLERRRLVRRLAAFDGEPGTFVQLTGGGQRLVERAIALGRTAYRRSEPAFAHAGERDRAAALRFLRRVVAALDAGSRR